VVDPDLDVPETPDVYGAYPRLTDQQIATLEKYGQVQQTQQGQVLFQEGDKTCDFFVILQGKVAIVEGFGYDDTVIGVHGPRRFLGELGLLPERPSLSPPFNKQARCWRYRSYASGSWSPRTRLSAISSCAPI
jgi:thioredoxin reductase (NADPH)